MLARLLAEPVPPDDFFLQAFIMEDDPLDRAQALLDLAQAGRWHELRDDRLQEWGESQEALGVALATERGGWMGGKAPPSSLRLTLPSTHTHRQSSGQRPRSVARRERDVRGLQVRPLCACLSGLSL